MNQGHNNVIKFPLKDFNKSEDSLVESNSTDEVISLDNIDEIYKGIQEKKPEAIQNIDNSQTFSPIDTDQINKIASENYEKGYNEGKKHADLECVKKISEYSDIIDSLNHAIVDLNLEKSESFKKLTLSIIEIIELSFKKFATEDKHNYHNHLNKFIQDIISNIENETEIELSFNPEFYSKNSKHLDEIIRKLQHSDRLKVINSEDISDGNCRVNWSSGCAELDSKKVFHEISSKLENFNDNTT